jgi:hypothetical protein
MTVMKLWKKFLENIENFEKKFTCIDRNFPCIDGNFPGMIANIVKFNEVYVITVVKGSNANMLLQWFAEFL